MSGTVRVVNEIATRTNVQEGEGYLAVDLAIQKLFDDGEPIYQSFYFDRRYANEMDLEAARKFVETCRHISNLYQDLGDKVERFMDGVNTEEILERARRMREEADRYRLTGSVTVASQWSEPTTSCEVRENDN